VNVPAFVLFAKNYPDHSGDFPRLELNWPTSIEPAPWEYFTLAVFGLN